MYLSAFLENLVGYLHDDITVGMRFHDLRHSTASILFDKGWDLESVKSWLRHADIETTSNIYLHISNGRKRLMAKDMTGTFIAPYSAKDNSDAENEESAG